ncbi:MAG: hypothetical protein P8144_09120, partial [Gammaproteobacteria bacterium]
YKFLGTQRPAKRQPIKIVPKHGLDFIKKTIVAKGNRFQTTRLRHQQHRALTGSLKPKSH